MGEFGFGNIDYFVIGGYLLITFLVGFFIKKRSTSTDEYFLAGRNMGWFVVGASIFATNFGSEHVIGNTRSGFESGLAYGNFEWIACLILIFMSWFVVPYLIKSKVFTVPEFFEKRFDERSRWYLSIVSMVAYILTKISVTLYAGGIVLKEVLGWDLYTSALLFTLVTGVYTIIGGLRTVIYTQAVQTVVMLIGGIVVLFCVINNLGGVETLVSNTPEGHLEIFKDAGHQDIPWTGVLLGMPVLAIWYWCTDQYIVQKALAANSIPTAQKGVLFAGFLKLLPVLLFMLPGIFVRSHLSRTGLELNGSEFGYIIREVLPVGVKGFAIALLLAALMSSLSSAFSSASAIFTLDIYKKIYPQSNDFQLYNIGQIATFAIVIFGIVWVPFISLMSQDIIHYLQEVQAHIAPPIAAVFLLGLFYKGTTSRSAFRGLILGGVFGIIRFLLVTFKDELPSLFGIEVLVEMNFLHFAFVLFAIVAAMVFFASYFNKAQNSGAVFMDKIGGSDVAISSISKVTVLFSSLLLLIVVILWILFS